MFDSMMPSTVLRASKALAEHDLCLNSQLQEPFGALLAR